MKKIPLASVLTPAGRIFAWLSAGLLFDQEYLGSTPDGANFFKDCPGREGGEPGIFWLLFIFPNELVHLGSQKLPNRRSI